MIGSPVDSYKCFVPWRQICEKLITGFIETNPIVSLYFGIQWLVNIVHVLEKFVELPNLPAVFVTNTTPVKMKVEVE